MKPEILGELLDRALAEPLGLSIRTNNAKHLQITFANYQREVAGSSRTHPVLACIPAEPNTVFLVKRSVELAP